MPSARDAREWAAAGGLHGIGNSLYTPFSGRDGDDIDFDAYRTLVRYCVDDLGHEMHRLAPGLVIWECDLIAYRAGWLQAGIVGPAQLGTAGYLHETPERPIYTQYWNLIWDGRLDEARRHAEESGLDQLGVDMNSWYTKYRGRPDYFTHWGEAFRCAASVVGLPIGDYPHSRPPQAVLPEEAKVDIRKAFENAGLARQPAHV